MKRVSIFKRYMVHRLSCVIGLYVENWNEMKVNNT